MPVKKVAYFIWKKPMVAGSDTFINELLKLNHFQNIYENKGRYQKSNSKKYV
jgi:ABC-type Fe3+-hydroxamate transport system substrate-binding protein